MPEPLYVFLRDLSDADAIAVNTWMRQHLPITVVDEMAEVIHKHHPVVTE